MTRILVFAYACEPGKGSEPGAGWAWSRMIARCGETWVITRANNREAIEADLPTLPERDTLHFVYVDVPSWAAFWKRGQRGIRLYYFLWLVAALRRAREEQRRNRFDVVWHLTLANAWLGSTAGFLGAPLIYGPVGGGVVAPWRLSGALGARGTAYEAVRVAARILGRYANPFSRAGWRRATIVLTQNPETRRWFPRRHRDKVRVLQHAVASAPASVVPNGKARPTALFASRLIPWKGGVLALHAIARLPEWRLVVCGSGADAQRLAALAAKLGVEQRVEFRGAVSQKEVAAAMIEASAFLHPSLHDDSPLAVTEALSAGLPVVCLDRGGPRVLAGEAGFVVSTEGVGALKVAERLADALQASQSPDAHRTALRRAHELSIEATVEKVGKLIAEVKSG